MSLVLHYHPLSSFCMKVLVGLYELDIPFTKVIVDLGDERKRREFLQLSPLGKIPTLEDARRREVVLETSTILEYIDRHYATGRSLLPTDVDLARECRFYDRFFDTYLQLPMQKIVGDRLRPEAKRDAFGVEEAKRQLTTAYAMAEQRLRGRTWALGGDFSLADCAAAPALFYADKVVPLGRYEGIAAYLDRLRTRGSFARVLEEAKPYEHSFPT